MAAWQHKQNPVPGDFYAVDGHQMHMDCTGTGSPAIVLESAASASFMLWRHVQPQLSTVTRVCSYDRAGHGWSEPREGPRDAEAIVRELHSLLNAAGVKRPFVYVAHSAGGLYAREHSREFQSELAAVGLLDASSPNQIDELPGWRASYQQDVRDQPRELFWEKVKVWSGWDRLTGRCRVSVSRKDQPFTGQYDAMECRPGFVGTDESELQDFERSSKQAGRLASFGKIPLLIISQDTDLQKAIAEKPIWAREQESSKALSPFSWRVIARASGHMVPLDRPDLVITEVTRLIVHLRGGPPPPFRSTVTR